MNVEHTNIRIYCYTIMTCKGRHCSCMEGVQEGNMMLQFGTIEETVPSPLHCGPGKGVNMGQSPTAVGMAG